MKFHWFPDLKDDGANVTVTNDNMEEYLRLQAEYRLLKRVQEQTK